MISLYTHLSNFSEIMPEWLLKFESGSSFPREEFLGSRIVFYPGSGTDGHAVKVFGSTHSAHCFVYADYAVGRHDLERVLDDQAKNFKGYQTFCRLKLNVEDLVPEGWTPHIKTQELPRMAHQISREKSNSYGFLEILERTEDFDQNHGPERLAVIFLGADGIAAYDALFCQTNSFIPPYSLILQDHGFGGNYDRFGKGGLLEKVAMRTNVYPEWILCADNTRPWSDYSPVPGVVGDPGGNHNNLRRLYGR